MEAEINTCQLGHYGACLTVHQRCSWVAPQGASASLAAMSPQGLSWPTSWQVSPDLSSKHPPPPNPHLSPLRIMSAISSCAIRRNDQMLPKHNVFVIRFGIQDVSQDLRHMWLVQIAPMYFEGMTACVA